MDEIQFPLHVLLRQESWDKNKAWVAQCLEYDITAQGPTIASAKQRFEETLLSYVLLLHSGEMQLSRLKPAPKEYFDEYESAEDLRNVIPIAMPQSQKASRSEVLLRVA